MPRELELMKTKKDIEKTIDNISPEISPGIAPTVSRSQKAMSVITEQEGELPLDIQVEKKS